MQQKLKESNAALMLEKVYHHCFVLLSHLLFSGWNFTFLSKESARGRSAERFYVIHSIKKSFR